MSIKVLIADDHEVVRSGLTRLLSGADVEIVGEATDGQEAITLATKKKPDVVLLDIRMPGIDGLQALEQIREKLPNARVIILSTYDNPTYMARSLALGADDYLLKGTSKQQLINSVTAKKNGTRSEPLKKVAGTLETRRTDVDDGVSLT
jgi:YesN/AraC family two-component response regulator